MYKHLHVVILDEHIDKEVFEILTYEDLEKIIPQLGVRKFFWMRYTALNKVIYQYIPVEKIIIIGDNQHNFFQEDKIQNSDEDT